MSHLKAPGPDGFSVSFYQANWNIINEEVCEAVLHFLNSGELDSDIKALFNKSLPSHFFLMSVWMIRRDFL